MKSTGLAARLADAFPLGKVETKQIVESVLAAIVEAASRGKEVAITGFGKFKVRRQAPREARNPGTGGPMHVAPSRKVTHQERQALRDAVNS